MRRQMALVLGKRLLSSLGVVAVVLSGVFVISHLIGDPVNMILPETATNEQRERLRAELGFDEGLLPQAVAFVKRVIGGFGDSMWQPEPAIRVVLNRMPATLLLATAAFAISATLGPLLALVAARRPGSRLDRTISVFSYGGVAIVDFWLGLVLILVFAVNLGWLPSGGWRGWHYVLLPAIAVSYRSVGRIAQVSRAALIEEYEKPYVEAVRSRGLSEKHVTRHVLRNAAPAVVTITGDEVASIVSGVIVIEVVFSWPGIGSLMLTAIQRRDLFLVEATIFVMAAVVIAVNLAVDLLYVWLEPSMRERDSSGASRVRAARTEKDAA